MQKVKCSLLCHVHIYNQQISVPHCTLMLHNFLVAFINIACLQAFSKIDGYKTAIFPQLFFLFLLSLNQTVKLKCVIGAHKVLVIILKRSQFLDASTNSPPSAPLWQVSTLATQLALGASTLTLTV